MCIYMCVCVVIPLVFERVVLLDLYEFIFSSAVHVILDTCVLKLKILTKGKSLQKENLYILLECALGTF